VGARDARPSLAVWKFASCDGCQLSLLDCEDELLALAGAVHIAHFTEMSRATVDGPYDVSLVEGSITTAEDAERIQEIRANSHRLITIGACASAGGIQALRNFAADGAYVGAVYAHPEYISSLSTSTPIAAHVAVDFELQGCPIDRHQLLEVITAALAGRKPVIATHTVCQECKGRGTVCLLVAHGTACLGPVTRAGVRSPVPVHRPGLLRLLRSFGGCQHRCPGPAPARERHGPGRRLTPVLHVLRRQPGVRAAVPVPVRGHGGRHNRRRPGRAMTHGSGAPRTVSIEGLSRVEGEGSLHVEVRDGVVEEVALNIFEPPRFFEALLQGRRATEAPDITARICGICPVAYQMSACAAVENALGVEVSREVADLRRLLYCGEWIQSHALHIYLLHAPDFLGCADAVELAERDRAAVERGLAIKKTGNLIMATVGGRAIHPVNVRVGGFYSAPARAAVAALSEPLRRARDQALDTVSWVAGFDFPDVEGAYRFVSLRTPGRYPIESGRVASSDGLDLSASAFDQLVVEEHVARSTALHARLGGQLDYLTGPLARYALNSSVLPEMARQAAAGAGLRSIVTNPFQSIIVRAVELVCACDEALRLVGSYEPPRPPAVGIPMREGVGSGVTEAPRGLLLHTYALNADGDIVTARIVPPTSQNQISIEADLRRVVQGGLDLSDADLSWRCEQAVRNHDPCISCAAHFLDVKVVRA
jgi:sulfhydrogenase subunit alpha